jgi:hypothetical protein
MAELTGYPDVCEAVRARYAAGQLTAAGLTDIGIAELHTVHQCAVSPIIRARKPAGEACCSSATLDVCCESSSKEYCCGQLAADAENAPPSCKYEPGGSSA